MQPLASYVRDLLGTRLGFAVFAIGWSAANMAHAFAVGWQSLSALRGLWGLTEAAVIPGSMKVVAEWFPPRERSMATGWFNIDSSVGAMIAPSLVVCLDRWAEFLAVNRRGGGNHRLPPIVRGHDIIRCHWHHRALHEVEL